MDQMTLSPATSSAATRETEPEVVAGISSGEGEPGLPLSFRTETARPDHFRTAVLLVAGLAVGLGVTSWWLRSR